MAEDENDRVAVGDLIGFFRWLRGGWSQARLAQQSGLYKSQICRYESGAETPRPANFQRIAAAVGVPLPLVDFLRWCLWLIRKALSMGQAVAVPRPTETPAAVGRAAERALALARAELALLRSAPPRPGPPTAEDHLRVEALFEKLKGYPEDQQRLLLQGAEAYRDWLLCLRLCAESEKAAAHDPGEAVKLAERALLVARHVPGTDAWRSRLLGRCTGFLANAERVGGDLRRAEATFARAWHLWREGEAEAALLSPACLLDLEASLRRDQRRFQRALELHKEALKAARPEEVGAILLNKSATLEEKGDYEASIAVLGQAARHVDGEREPRLAFGVCFNRAANLGRLGRAADAAGLLPEVRALAERLHNDIDLIKTLWLEANVAAGLGRREEARAKLAQVRRAFDQRKLPYDYALASLDLALLCREEGRCGEIKALAEEMLAIFEAQGVHREAIAALLLFRDAAEREQVTGELVRRLQDYLAKARSNAQLRFEDLPR